MIAHTRAVFPEDRRGECEEICNVSS